MTVNKDILKLLKKTGAICEDSKPTEFVSTGSYALNFAMAGSFLKGAPCPGVIEFSGESSTAKTVFLAHIFREAQKCGWYTKLEDAETTWNDDFARSLGVNPEELLKNQPYTIETAFQSMEDTILAIREIDKETPIVIGLDSLAVLPSDKEDEGSYNQAETMGMIRAKATGGCLRKIHKLAKQHHVLFVIINQIRKKMVMYGSPDTRAAGGNALEFYLSCAFKTVSTKNEKTGSIITNEQGKAIGIRGTLKNTKNKLASPFMECGFELYFDKGLSEFYGLAEILEIEGITEREKGSQWTTYNGKKFRAKDIEKHILDKDCKEFDPLREMLGL